ncbi:hypothetical protein [Cellulophaga lytica]|nr:hypothetical protein [Cellulophaga lytica]
MVLENGILKEATVFGKKIALKDITYIRKTKEQYILKTADKELVVHIKQVEEESLKNLDNVLANLDLPAEKNPFSVS